MLLLTEYITQTDAHAHTNIQEELGSNEARGDPGELSVSPQLADTQSTTSVTSFLKLGKPVELHQKQPKEKPEVKWIWTEKGEGRMG